MVKSCDLKTWFLSVWGDYDNQTCWIMYFSNGKPNMGTIGTIHSCLSCRFVLGRLVEHLINLPVGTWIWPLDRFWSSTWVQTMFKTSALTYASPGTVCKTQTEKIHQSLASPCLDHHIHGFSKFEFLNIQKPVNGHISGKILEIVSRLVTPQEGLSIHSLWMEKSICKVKYVFVLILLEDLQNLRPTFDQNQFSQRDVPTRFLIVGICTQNNLKSWDFHPFSSFLKLIRNRNMKNPFSIKNTLFWWI